MKIGIMSAMIEEVLFIKEAMRDVATKTIGNREYYAGRLNGVDTVLLLRKFVTNI